MTMGSIGVGLFQKELREKIKPGTKIIKPRSTSRIIRWERTGQNERIFYSIGKAGNEKYINISELSQAYEELINSGELNQRWFKQHMPKRADNSPCNYTTIGGVLQLLGYAVYDRGVYRKR